MPTLNSVYVFRPHVIILVVLTLFLCINPFSIETNLAAAASCFNNIGPGFGIAGPGVQLLLLQRHFQVRPDHRHALWAVGDLPHAVGAVAFYLDEGVSVLIRLKRTTLHCVVLLFCAAGLGVSSKRIILQNLEAPCVRGGGTQCRRGCPSSIGRGECAPSGLCCVVDNPSVSRCG